jgi:hypothetical protein
MRRNIKRAKLMVTGGFRTAQGMADAITTGGVDLIGLSRPLCLDPDAPAALLRGTQSSVTAWENELRVGPGLVGPHSRIKLIRAINGLGSMTWFNAQMIRMSQGLPPDPKMGFIPAFIRMQMLDKRMARAIQHKD